MLKKYDYVIFGAGIFGLYASLTLAQRGKSVALVEFDAEPMQRASFINQARVHNGYHYPRSVSTAVKSANYYRRFSQDFSFAVNKQFRKVYAISSHDSLTNAEQFVKFCEYVDIPIEEINSKHIFNTGMVEAAFDTLEFSYDANKIRSYFVEKLKEFSKVDVLYGQQLTQTEVVADEYKLIFKDGRIMLSPFVVNATYASLNQILNLFNYEMFKIKYEICEVILTQANSFLKDTGVTIMDGPFFSAMPFGLSGTHSLTSVGHTPHLTSTDKLPSFDCQQRNAHCFPSSLQNCNTCMEKPTSAWVKMYQLFKKYMNPKMDVQYKESLFAVKTIMAEAEIDDSRPTIIKSFSNQPTFISVMSGKFNTIYDLEEALH